MKHDQLSIAAGETKIEKLPMDEDTVKIINRILDQNEKILAQNARLFEILSKPMFVMQTPTPS